MILNVPKKIRDDEGLHNLFQGLKVPYPTTSVHIGTTLSSSLNSSILTLNMFHSS